MRFLDIMLLILGMIGVSIIILCVWFALSVHVVGMEDIMFKFNVLTFFTGLSYIVFIMIILKLVKKNRVP
jgi:hypothetical protein